MNGSECELPWSVDSVPFWPGPIWRWDEMRWRGTGWVGQVLLWRPWASSPYHTIILHWHLYSQKVCPSFSSGHGSFHVQTTVLVYSQSKAIWTQPEVFCNAFFSSTSKEKAITACYVCCNGCWSELYAVFVFPVLVVVVVVVFFVRLYFFFFLAFCLYQSVGMCSWWISALGFVNCFKNFLDFAHLHARESSLWVKKEENS